MDAACQSGVAQGFEINGLLVRLGGQIEVLGFEFDATEEGPPEGVVGSDGKLQGYAGGVEIKARLLAAEQTGPVNGRLF